MERPSIVGTGARVSRNYRDNMFKDLFSREEYLLRLYRWKHPDGRRTIISDIRLEGLTDCISVGTKNDLGFSVRGRGIVLVEAQTTLSLNILPRMLGYLIDTWDIEPMRQRGRSVGIEIGLEKGIGKGLDLGKTEAVIGMAKAFKARNVAAKTTCECTGLSAEEILKL